MSDKKPIDLGLTSALDELFMDEQGRKENALPKIYDIPLSEIPCKFESSRREIRVKSVR